MENGRLTIRPVNDVAPSYLLPYVNAARKHGAGFGSLLWANPGTQGARFNAFTRLYDFSGKLMLDVGCGRADLHDYLLARQIVPEHYVGLEGVEPLARAATAKRRENAQIIRADFVTEPHRLLVGADAVVISGSLNTLHQPAFFSTLRTAYEAATEVVIFNFLSSTVLAGADYLHWYHTEELIAFGKTLTPRVEVLDDYLRGDTTISLRKPPHDEAPA